MSLLNVTSNVSFQQFFWFWFWTKLMKGMCSRFLLSFLMCTSRYEVYSPMLILQILKKFDRMGRGLWCPESSKTKLEKKILKRSTVLGLKLPIYGMINFVFIIDSVALSCSIELNVITISVKPVTLHANLATKWQVLFFNYVSRGWFITWPVVFMV